MLYSHGFSVDCFDEANHLHFGEYCVDILMIFDNVVVDIAVARSPSNLP